jgi:hypothetical protein
VENTSSYLDHYEVTTMTDCLHEEEHEYANNNIRCLESQQQKSKVFNIYLLSTHSPNQSISVPVWMLDKFEHS